MAQWLPLKRRAIERVRPVAGMDSRFRGNDGGQWE